MKHCAIAIAIAIAALLLGLSAPAHSQSAAAFYKGKTVTVIAPTDTGGSIYEAALLVSLHIGKHLAGSPKVIVQARPGGGGITASNYMARNAVKDGTILAEMHTGALLVPMTSSTAAYDPRTFQWLGSIAVRTYVGAVWHTVPVNSLDDLKKQEIIFGANGTGSPGYQYPMFLAHVLKARIRVIPAYKSGGETNMAMERGEVHARGNFYEGFLATNADWIRDKKVKFIFKMGPDHPDLANVPPASRFMTNASQQQMLRVLESPLALGQAFYLPAGVPADRVAALREAFEKMLADAAFKSEADKMGLFINPRGHGEVADVVQKVYETPKEVMAELDAILYKK